MALRANSVPVNRLTQSLGILFSGVTTGGGARLFTCQVFAGN